MSARPLYDMFGQVTSRYDLLNRILTLGLDQRWRRRAARVCLLGRPARVLDLCCGTADLAMLLAGEAVGEIEIVAADFSEAMLAAAKRKVEAAGHADRVSLQLADAAELPFPDGYFQAVGIAFAFRNLTFKRPESSRYLVEVLRVLVPGGRFVIVETSQPPWPVLRRGFHIYLRDWVDPIGRLLSGHRGAYRYLSVSARQYPPPDGVARMLKEAGFSHVEHTPLLGGVAAIHVATR